MEQIYRIGIDHGYGNIKTAHHIFESGVIERERVSELEVMRLRNEINKIGVNINQIVKNSNSHIYREDDKMELKSQINKAADLMECMVKKIG